MVSVSRGVYTAHTHQGSPKCIPVLRGNQLGEPQYHFLPGCPICTASAPQWCQQPCLTPPCPADLRSLGWGRLPWDSRAQRAERSFSLVYSLLLSDTGMSSQ